MDFYYFKIKAFFEGHSRAGLAVLLVLGLEGLFLPLMFLPPWPDHPEVSFGAYFGLLGLTGGMYYLARRGWEQLPGGVVAVVPNILATYFYYLNVRTGYSDSFQAMGVLFFTFTVTFGLTRFVLGKRWLWGLYGVDAIVIVWSHLLYEGLVDGFYSGLFELPVCAALAGLVHYAVGYIEMKERWAIAEINRARSVQREYELRIQINEILEQVQYLSEREQISRERLEEILRGFRLRGITIESGFVHNTPRDMWGKLVWTLRRDDNHRFKVKMSLDCKLVYRDEVVVVAMLMTEKEKIRGIEKHIPYLEAILVFKIVDDTVEIVGDFVVAKIN